MTGSDGTLPEVDPRTRDSRRDFLDYAAAGAAIRPLVNAMNPSADVLSLSQVRVDLSDSARENPNHSGTAPALDQNRTADAAGEWPVVIGICTNLGCVPVGQGSGDSFGEYGGWFSPCHGSHYDTSGRIRKGSAPRNLDTTVYTLADDLTLTIGT